MYNNLMTGLFQFSMEIKKFLRHKDFDARKIVGQNEGDWYVHYDFTCIKSM